MKRTTATWTMTVTAAALLAVPTAGVARIATQPPATTQPAAAIPSSASQASTAQEHLRHARASLNDVPATGLSARGKAQVGELKRRLTTLEKTSSAKGSAWATEVAAIDKILTGLLAPEMTAGTSGNTAAPAARGKAAATVTLDDASRAKLTEVRTAVTAYAAAMSGQPAATPSDAAAAPTSSPMPTDPSVPPAQATAPPAASSAASAATTQKVEEASRRHLTEAKATLTALTQLPAAGQLTGDARTQVSQLISNFNELITTQTDWRAAYAKVAANLTALLGPDTGTTQPPSAAPATAGATGTTGTAPAMDPAVRAKLLEMRKNLADFERVAGGGAASPSISAPAAPPAATAPTATTAMATTPATATPTDTAAAPAAHAGAMSHIAAIEAMLKRSDDSGGLTLDKAQADMLRTHLAELRKLLEQVKK